MASPEDDDNDDTSTRLDAELSLLDAMYPSSVTYSPRSREVRFKASSGELQLRLPDTYPRHGLPSVISACDGARNDLRERVRGAMLELALVQGEECLDRVVGAFEAVLEDESTNTESARPRDSVPASTDPHVQKQDPTSPKTVIIWLHHLLATSKRKLAITPTVQASPSTPTPNTTPSSISGITKPGYPGIMIFSGGAGLVDAHVRELKDLNWQAFQVRYDSADDGGGPARWRFAHEEDDEGLESRKARIVEVETMAQLVKGIVGAREREVFLRVVGVK